MHASESATSPAMMRSIVILTLIAAVMPLIAGAQETFWVRAGDRSSELRPAALSLLKGVEVVADYGDALLVRVQSAAAREALQQRFQTRLLPDATKIGHWKGSFDPLSKTSSQRFVHASESTSASTPGLHLVQFVGPPKDEWLEEVTTLGVELVTYFPHSAYLARVDPKLYGELKRLSFVRWVGVWAADMKFDPETDALRGSDPSAELEINFVLFNPKRDLNATAAEKILLAQSGGTLLQDALSGNHEIVRAHVRAGALNGLAAHPNVISVEAWHQPVRDDESTSLTVAGHYTGEIGNSPPNPTYASWLATIGYTGSGTTVGVVDDGVDTTEVHLSGRVTNILSGANSGAEGHGHHVAGIVAGSCSHTSDALGYKFGAGVAPGASILNQPLLDSSPPSAWNNTCGTSTDYGCLTQQTVTTAGTNGVNGYVQNNSWGAGTASPMTYTSIEREYDLRVRDANEATTAVNEPLVIGFSAGNSGNAGLTRPKSAKNIITTGATDAYRPTVKSPYGPGSGGGCDGLSALPSSNLNMMVCFSSYGNAQDGRIKPDVVAPGGNIASALSGSDTLWGDIDANHRWCSGTSQAAPHTAGMAALIVDKWKAENSGTNPSPAMVKAKLINTAVEMRTSTTAPASSVYPVPSNLPNNREGWGRLDTKRHLSPSVQIMHRDQDAADTFGTTGEMRTFDWYVDSSAEPLYVTLVWTDAAAAVNANPALVNNLDLEVIVNGTTYLGNVLSTAGMTGKLSLTGGTADSINNVENVFLPSVTANDTVQVRVIATAINGDGIPANADVTDQDFALVVYNAKPCTPPAVPAPNASAGPAPDEITLTWSEVAGASQYYIYRSDGACNGGSFSLVQTINSGATTSWTDTTVTGGNTYSYTMSSFAVCESAQSSCTDATAFSCSTPQPPSALTTSAPAFNTIHLSWTASPTVGVTYAVYRSDGACPGGAFTQVASGLTGTTWDDTAVAGGLQYSYQVTAFEFTCESTATSCADATATGGPGIYSTAMHTAGAPRNTTAGQPVRWIYSSAATAMNPPTVNSAIYSASNDRLFHSVERSATGGRWPRTAPKDWKPLVMNAPAQGRSTVYTLTVEYPFAPGTFTTRVAYLASQDGRVYCVDADNGTLLWTSPALGDMLQGLPSIYARKWDTSGSPLGIDMILVGTRNSSGANDVVGLNAATGAIVWTFDNGGGATGIGMINGGIVVDQAKKLAWFASRKLSPGSSNTIWNISFDDTAAAPTLMWAADAGDIDGTPTPRGTTIYVGNNAGTVSAWAAEPGVASPSALWTFATSNGPIKEMVFPDYSNLRLYFSSTDRVWCLVDNSNSASEAWSTPASGVGAIARPSRPLPYLGTAWIGSSDGNVYKITGITTLTGTPSPVSIGALGGGAVGAPSIDGSNSLIHVGTEGGLLFAVTP